jgi:competence protein ComEC
MAETKYSFNVLDVGQGSMQLIEEGDLTNIVVDCNISKAPEFVRRYLGRRKVGHIDVVVFTGTDQDHADAEGFQMLINFVGGRINQVWYPAYEADTDNWKAILKLIDGLKEKGATVWKPSAGEMRTVNGLTVRILSPEAGASGTSNDASLVLKFTGDNVSIKNYGHWLPAQILVAPHHGSKNGCVEAAIELIAPEYTVISCGEDNPHGHPDDEAVKVYEKYTSVAVYITYKDGSVLFESDGKTITNVVLDAGEDEAGRKLAESRVKRVDGLAKRPGTTRTVGTVATLGDAVRGARPHQNAPQDRVGFGRA